MVRCVVRAKCYEGNYRGVLRVIKIQRNLRQVSFDRARRTILRQRNHHKGVFCVGESGHQLPQAFESPNSRPRRMRASSAVKVAIFRRTIDGSSPSAWHSSRKSLLSRNTQLVASSPSSITFGSSVSSALAQSTAARLRTRASSRWNQGMDGVSTSHVRKSRSDDDSDLEGAAGRGSGRRALDPFAFFWFT